MTLLFPVSRFLQQKVRQLEEEKSTMNGTLSKYKVTSSLGPSLYSACRVDNAIQSGSRNFWRRRDQLAF